MKHLEEVIINYDKKLMEANIEIERLNNIIKEVREYIEKGKTFENEDPRRIIEKLQNNILQILDKEDL